MPDYKKLVKALQTHADIEASCTDCPYFVEGIDECVPQMSKDAADAIEKLLNKLCDWCGACLGERNPFDCEIIGTAFAVPPDPGEGSLN